MSTTAIRSRLRQLERARHAADNRPPDLEELRSEARGEPVRPSVAALAARMRAYGVELEAATLGFSPWPRA